MGLENGIGKKDMAAFVKSRAVNIKDMTEMASTMANVFGESEKETNKDKSLSEILSALVGRGKIKNAYKDVEKDDGR